MVDLALNWSTVSEQHICHMVAPMQGGPIGLKPYANEVLSITTDACTDDPKRRVRYLEHVQAKVN